MIDSAIFIVGYMHSGTSMVQHMISNHTQVFSPPGEVKLIENLDSMPDINYMSSTTKSEYYLNCIRNGFHFNKYHSINRELPMDELEVLNSVQYTSDHVENFFNCLDALKNHFGKSIWLEKSLNNIFYSKIIKKYISNPKFIGIIRDPRDVVASKKIREATLDSGRYKQEQIPLKKLEKHSVPILDALSWRSTARQILNKSSITPSTFITVQYEDLVNKPEIYVKNILEFIGLPYDSEILDFSFSNSADPKQKKGRGISKSAVGRYKSKLTEAEVCAVQWVTRKELKQLNILPEPISLVSNIIALKYFMRLPYDLFIRLLKRYRLLGSGIFKSFLKILYRKLKSV